MYRISSKNKLWGLFFAILGWGLFRNKGFLGVGAFNGRQKFRAIAGGWRFFIF